MQDRDVTLWYRTSMATHPAGAGGLQVPTSAPRDRLPPGH